MSRQHRKRGNLTEARKRIIEITRECAGAGLTIVAERLLDIVKYIDGTKQ